MYLPYAIEQVRAALPLVAVTLLAPVPSMDALIAGARHSVDEAQNKAIILHDVLVVTGSVLQDNYSCKKLLVKTNRGDSAVHPYLEGSPTDWVNIQPNTKDESVVQPDLKGYPIDWVNVQPSAKDKQEDANLGKDNWVPKVLSINWWLGKQK